MKPRSLDLIVEEASHLPQETVIELVDRLMVQMHGGIGQVQEEAWATELHKRLAEIRSGKVEGVPGDQVMAELRKIVGL